MVNTKEMLNSNCDGAIRTNIFVATISNHNKVKHFTKIYQFHDNVIKWKYFPHYWPFVRGIHRSMVNSPHKGQWRRALMFSLICSWIHGWVNNPEAGDLRCHCAHYDVTVMLFVLSSEGSESNEQLSLANASLYKSSSIEMLTPEEEYVDIVPSMDRGKGYKGLGFEFEIWANLIGF